MEALPKKPVAHKAVADKPAKKPAVAKPHAVRKPKVAKEAAPVAKPVEAEKPAEVTSEVAPEPVKPTVKIAHGKTFYAVGRRKTAVSQAVLSAGNGTITLNKIPFESYFQTQDLQQIVTSPLRQLGVEKQFNIKAKIHGGGIHAQAESLRHAISRGLIEHDPESRRTLKKLGFLKRDPRVKERKKPGLKRARRAPQFSKR